MTRINLICLGVRNLVRSRAFYEHALGFTTPNTEADPQIVFFNNGGSRLELYQRDALIADVYADDAPPLADAQHVFTGVTLAYNAKSAAEVDAVFARVEAAGGTIAKTPAPAFWGGYSGYFRDPDGHHWEVAYADSWQFDSTDMLVIE